MNAVLVFFDRTSYIVKHDYKDLQGSVSKKKKNKKLRGIQNKKTIYIFSFTRWNGTRRISETDPDRDKTRTRSEIVWIPIKDGSK